MDNVNDIIDMLKDRLVEATRKTVRIEAPKSLVEEYRAYLRYLLED